MPEREGDPKGVWKYETGFPGADLKVNPIAVQLPNLVEAVGLDGRFVGALRPFPGMADKTIHGVPAPSGSTTITSISNIQFARYAAIQKGLSGDTLKGIVYVADNPGATGSSVYFAYRDSSDGSSDVVELEDLDSWTDFKLTSIDELDVTSLGRYIYFSASGDTTSNVTHYQNKEPAYNKAYFWDFKINTWDKFVTGFDGRFMGLMARRLLGTPLMADVSGDRNSSDEFANQTYGPAGFTFPDGDYTYALELVSRKHNLRSYIRWHSLADLTTPNSGIRYFVASVKLPADQGGATHQIKGNTHELTCIISWGIPHVDGFRLWRSPVNDFGANFDKYTLLGNLFLVDAYLEKGVYQPTSAILFFQFDHDSILGTVFNDAKSAFFEDSGLLSQQQYNAFLDSFGAAPRFKRIQAYDGLLVGITDVEEPSTPDKEWQPNEQKPEAIAWSALHKFDEPENFPPENQYRPDDAAERFLSLEPVGDHLFGVSNAGIYRVSRSGSQMAINRIQFRLGGVSRFGQAGVGSLLFVVTAAGLKQVDANTGAITSVSIFDRILLDDSEWAASLADVHMEYDALVGALVLLNTTKNEVYILWESTGAVTKVEGAPWSFLTAGPDVLTDGPQRAYFITSTGGVHTIDGARAMGKRSMCGTTATETVNGTFTTGTTATTLVDSTATFPVNCPGFEVHILSGTLLGETATVTTRDSATQLTVTGLSAAPAVGVRYSVSPIVTRVVLPQMVGQGGQTDPFVRKVSSSMAVAFSDLGGETTSGSNNKFTMGMKQMATTLGTIEVDFNLVPDKTFGRINRASTRLFPFLEFKGGNQDYEIQAVLVKGLLTTSEAQSRQT